MAGQINQNDPHYSHFVDGAISSYPQLTTQDKHMIDFAIRMHNEPALKTQGQILLHFGMYPPEFWRRAQAIANHPDIEPEQKAELDKIFPDPSRPGPMTGGYNVLLGLEQYP